MKFQLFQTATGFESVIFDDSKMIPDPQFRRSFQWGKPSVLAPQQKDESAEAFRARHADHSKAVDAYLLQIETESLRLYAAEFEKPARVLAAEKEFSEPCK